MTCRCRQLCSSRLKAFRTEFLPSLQ